MNKKIVLTCLAAGILMCMLPAQKVNAAENQTAEDYYYQLLISGSYPYNTPANTGNAGAGVPVMPAGGWEHMVSLANLQLTQAVARQQALEATRQNLDGQLQAAAQAVVQAQAALTAAQQAYASALQAAAYSQQAALLNQQAALGNPGAGNTQLTAAALPAETILQVQNLLTFYGCACSPTGVYDVQTQAALIAFQTKYGLVVDGTINAQVLQLFGLG